MIEKIELFLIENLWAVVAGAVAFGVIVGAVIL